MINNLSVVMVAVLAVHVSFAQKKHREHSAHQHGAGKMAIAFDGLSGKIDLRVASESIIGFEHKPKTETEKNQQQAALDLLEKNISDMIQFAPTAKCQITKDSISVVYEEDDANKKEKLQSQHSETLASFSVLCQKSLQGTRLTFNVQKVFPKIRDLDVDLLIGSKQTSLEAKKNGDSIEL